MADHIAVARARRTADLPSVGRIDRPTSGTATINAETLAATKPAPTIVHDAVPSSVAPDRTRLDDERGGQQTAGARYVVAVPVTITGVRRGDTFTLTDAGDDGDPDLVGVPLTVDVVDKRSRVVLRRLRCVDTRGTDGRLP